MSIRVRVHPLNDEPFEADMEELPAVAASYILVTNPRKPDGRNLPWDTGRTKGYIFPFARIAFIEILVGRHEEGEIEKPWRDNTKGAF